MELQRAKGKPRLDPNGGDAVLIGFKGTAQLHEQTRECARNLGLTYSELLRVLVVGGIKTIEKTIKESRE